MSRLRAPEAVTIVTAAMFVPVTLFGHEADPSRFTYRDHVRPIFVEHCSGCHRPGGAGPMSLLEYQEAVPWATAVKMQVLESRMPPWLPEDGVGRFRHARSLSAEEIDIIIDWAVGQAPEGEAVVAGEISDERPGGAEPQGGGGAPDLLLAPADEVVFGADEYEKTACVLLPTGLEEPELSAGFEVRPELAAVTRRATIRLGESCQEGAPPLATWLPGQRRVTLGEGRGITLVAGATLAVEIRYVKGWNDEGKRLVDRPRVAVWFASSGRPVLTRQISTASETLDEPVSLVAIYPEPEGPGADALFVEARLPDGEILPLLAIESYDAAWREKYVLAQPLELPSGTEIVVSQPTVWIDFMSVRSDSAQ